MLNSRLTDAQNRYFHVTPKCNLKSILENGLVAQVGERSDILGEKPGIWLFPTFDEMNNALANWLGECFDEDEELVILQLDLPEDFPIAKEPDSNGSVFYEVCCRKNIPADYVSGVYDEYYDEIEEKKEEVDLPR